MYSRPTQDGGGYRIHKYPQVHSNMERKERHDSNATEAATNEGDLLTWAKVNIID